MAKNSYFFSHDMGARNDPKLQKVLMKLGHAGKGVFWDLVEMMHEEGGYLELSECDNYAFALRADVNCIASLINDFGLFENDGVKFWSESALRRIKEREEKSKKAAESAISRWKNANASKNDANALRTESEGNAIKEIKERKENKRVVAFTPPSILEVKEFFKEKGYTEFIAEKAYSYYNDHEWKDSKGNKVKNWKQKMQAVWFKDENKIVNKYEPAKAGVVNPGARHWM